MIKFIRITNIYVQSHRVRIIQLRTHKTTSNQSDIKTLNYIEEIQMVVSL